jgi:hypothetical protein
MYHNMQDTQQARLAKWEHLQKTGALRFGLTCGFIFAAPLGILIFIISPPMPWYVLALLVYFCGVVLAVALRFGLLWEYSRTLNKD